MVRMLSGSMGKGAGKKICGGKENESACGEEEIEGEWKGWVRGE